jgi:hypothetical protein
MTLHKEVMQLATQVPAPPGEPLPPGLSDSEIDGFAERTGLAIPPELREWLRFTNGPCIGPGGIYGIRPRRKHLDMEAVYEYLPEFKKNRWLPLGTDGCGNYYVLALASEPESLRPVYFVDAYQDGGYGRPTYAVASELWQFLRFLFRAELGKGGWPFDSRTVLRSDPMLAQVYGAPLPWKADAKSGG